MAQDNLNSACPSHQRKATDFSDLFLPTNVKLYGLSDLQRAVYQEILHLGSGFLVPGGILGISFFPEKLQWF